jgi:hypothetical protein
MRKLMNPRQAAITAIPGSRSKPASTPLSLSTPGYAQTFDRDYVVRGRAERFDQSQHTEDAALGGLRALTLQSPNSRSEKTDSKAKERRAGLAAKKRHDQEHASAPRPAGWSLRVSVAA